MEQENFTLKTRLAMLWEKWTEQPSIITCFGLILAAFGVSSIFLFSLLDMIWISLLFLGIGVVFIFVGSFLVGYRHTTAEKAAREKRAAQESKRKSEKTVDIH